MADQGEVFRELELLSKRVSALESAFAEVKRPIDRLSKAEHRVAAAEERAVAVEERARRAGVEAELLVSELRGAVDGLSSRVSALEPPDEPTLPGTGLPPPSSPERPEPTD